MEDSARYISAGAEVETAPVGFNVQRIKDYTETVVSIIDGYDTSVIEAILVAKVPYEIRDEVKAAVYSRLKG
ncbi:MAG: hypothetical protein E7Z64_02020 [Thermoplasmata archaeon]|jgi:hypothetical protein|nr:hypothetical protein [Thermoplasmata archaeon]